MIVYNKNDKNLVVPSSLGNISTGSGGSGVTPEDVEIMIDQAIDTYNEGIQGQFDSTNTAVSGNTENIEAISAKTQSIGNSVENLSAITSGISNDLTSLGNDVEELSGVTSGIATDLETLSANTTVVSWEQNLSAGTQIAQITINGQSQSVFAPEGAASDAVIYDYNEVNRLSTDEKIAVWRKMSQEKIDGKQVWFKKIESETIYWYIMNRGSAGTGAHFFYAFDNNYIYTLSFNYNGTFAPSLSLSQKEILPKASSSTLGGIKVGSGLTIDANGVLSADGGGGGDTTVIDFDTMSQAELAALFTEIYAKWSGSSINGEYTFLKSFGDYTPDNQGTRQMRLQFITAEGDSTLDFGAATYNPYDGNRVITWSFRLYSDGTYYAQTGGVRGVDKDMSNVGYFDTWNEALGFNKLTSAFTHNGETVTDGTRFGGSFYWFIVNAAQGDWGLGVPLLMFEVTDESGVTTTYQYPSMSKKPVSITIGDITYDTEAKFNYGEISLKMYLDSNPAVAGLTVIQNY